MNINGTNDFQDFLNTYPKYSKYALNPIAHDIFAELSILSNIQKMIFASDSDKPALAACISCIESKYGNQNVFDLSDDFTKQALGSMVKVVLEPFGYDPIKQKKLPNGTSKFLSSASVYNFNANPKIKLIQKLDVEKIF